MRPRLRLTNAVTVNARVLAVPSNGQKRVAQEIINRIDNLDLATPAGSSASGLRGHAWEQFRLPMLASKRRLWSPSTSGPIRHSNHIVTIHDIAFVDGPQWFSRSFSGLYDIVAGQLVKTARHIISVSEFTRQRLIEHYGAHPDRVTTVYSGTTTSFRRQHPETVRQIVDRFGLNDRQYVVAFLGHDPRKNLAGILRAWQIVSKRNPEARLVTFGRVSNASVFASANISSQASGVIHVGPASDEELASLYSGASALVFPSLYEGFGLPVIEAASCGCRIITSNRSALPEVSPSDAILVDPESDAEIANAIEYVLQNNDTPDAISARIEFTAKFCWDTTAASYAHIFEEHFR